MRLTEEQEREILNKMADCFPDNIEIIDAMDLAKRFMVYNILHAAKSGKELELAVAVTHNIVDIISILRPENEMEKQ